MDAGRRNGTLRALLAATTVAAVALLAMVPAFACGPTSTARISPEGGAPGINAMVTGTLFKASMGEVVVKWGGAGGVLLATAVVDAEGSFGPVQVAIPADAEPGRLAILAVYQPGDPSARVSNVTFQVAGTPVTAAPAAPAPVDPTPATQPAAAAAPTPSPAPASEPAPAPAAVPTRERQPRVVTGPAAVATTVPAASPAPAAAPLPAVAAATPIAPPLELPEITETDPARSAPEPARPADVAATGARGEDGGRSLWVVVPLVALGFTLLAVGIAVVYEPRRRGEAVRSRLGGRRR